MELDLLPVQGSVVRGSSRDKAVRAIMVTQVRR